MDGDGVIYEDITSC